MSHKEISKSDVPGIPEARCNKTLHCFGKLSKDADGFEFYLHSIAYNVRVSRDSARVHVLCPFISNHYLN